MKILFVLPRYHTNQYFWTKTLKENGHEVSYLVAEKTAGENYDLTEPVAVTHHPLPSWLHSLLFWYMKTFNSKVRGQFLSWPDRRELRVRLKNIQPDLVVIREVSYPLSFVSYIECNRLGLPVLRYTQYPLEKSERPLTRVLKILKIVPPLSITPSRLHRNISENTKTGAYYVPLITDFPFDFSNRNYQPDDTTRLLFIGKFVSVRKNHLLLLDALHKIKEKRKFHLTMIGTNGNAKTEYLEEIRTKIEECNLTDRVDIKTNIPHQQMSDIYRETDLFVLPSANEAFSISPIEAMNHAVGAIITDTNGAKHTIEDGVNGYVVDTGSVDDLSEKILLATKDKETLMGLGKNAYTYHQQEHTPKVMYKYFRNAIDKALAKHL